MSTDKHDNGLSGPSTNAPPSRASTSLPHVDTPSIHQEPLTLASLETGIDGQRRQRLETPKDEAVLKLTDQSNLLPFRKVVSVFAGLAVCIVVSTLDMTLVATALPSIATHFHAGTSSPWITSVYDKETLSSKLGSVSSFVPSTYLLTSTAFQPLYGRFSDIFGRKVALCIAMSVFMLGNLAAGFSRSIGEVIVFRGMCHRRPTACTDDS